VPDKVAGGHYDGVAKEEEDVEISNATDQDSLGEKDPREHYKGLVTEKNNISKIGHAASEEGLKGKPEALNNRPKLVEAQKKP